MQNITKEFGRMVEIFHFWLVVVVPLVYTFIKIHQTAPFKEMHFI